MNSASLPARPARRTSTASAAAAPAIAATRDARFHTAPWPVHSSASTGLAADPRQPGRL